MEFAAQLKHYRQAKGWSQEELATQLFLSRQAVSKWEQGLATPDLATLVKLAGLFGVSLDELVLAQSPVPQRLTGSGAVLLAGAMGLNLLMFAYLLFG